MDIQQKIQLSIEKDIKKNNFRGIIVVAMRTGKTRICLNVVKNNFKNPKILVMYPNVDIKSSWEKECEKLNYHPNITYSTYKSSKKYINEKFDIIFMDEIHLIAPTENELENVSLITKNNSNCILMTGTLNNNTKDDIVSATGLNIISNYPLEQAIKDGIVANYNVYVHRFKLNSEKRVKMKGKVKEWYSTDKKECDRLSGKILEHKKNNEYDKLKFAALNRMRFINTCNSLVEKVNEWQI